VEAPLACAGACRARAYVVALLEPLAVSWNLSPRAFDIAFMRASESFAEGDRQRARLVVDILNKYNATSVQSTAEMFRVVGAIISDMAEQFENVQAAVDLVEGTGP
jgi:hypothetical protein